jgi:adenine-specific DNA-methyltransferase
MATGVPIQTHGEDGDIHLVYPGKRGVAEIVQPRAVELRTCYAASPANRLYFGDNLDILHALRQDPRVCGKVKLVYIDPPFATQTAFYSRQQQHAYTDNLSRPAYLEFLRERLVLLRELLAEDGSLYLHLDEKMLFEMKILLDELFGADNYRNLIVRKKCNPKNYTRNSYGNIADFILFYTKSDQYIWNRPTEGLSPESLQEYRYVEPETGRRFMKVPLHAPGTRNGETGKPWRGMSPPPGKHWQYPPETLDEMAARGEIFWSKNGNPRRKVYLDTHPGVGVQDIWLEFKDAHNQNIKITGYPTEKNPDLLRRIIEASSNPGDLVLDCFAGSGTTLAVADALQRRWIGVDNSPEALRTILERFASGLQPMGDFVKPRETDANPQVSLFDTPDTALVSPAAHRAISEFSLFAVAEAYPAIMATLQTRDEQAAPLIRSTQELMKT